jgi:hypothetical protein
MNTPHDGTPLVTENPSDMAEHPSQKRILTPCTEQWPYVELIVDNNMIVLDGRNNKAHVLCCPHTDFSTQGLNGHIHTQTGLIGQVLHKAM